MKIVITGSLGHISKPLVKTLVAAKHNVTVVSSKPEREAEIIALGAEAAIGSVEDVNFLTKTFKGADAVYTMTPPNFAAQDQKAYYELVGKNYAEAIKASGVKNVVNLSSMGAHMPEGCGPVSGAFRVEQTLNQLQGVNIIHLRPGSFYTNFFNNIGMIKHMGFIGNNWGATTKHVMSDTDDIAEVAAHELQKLSYHGKNIAYVISDEKTPEKIAQILGKAIGKPDLKWVDIKDEDTIAGMIQAGVPTEMAKSLTEMGVAMRTGQMAAHFNKHRPTRFHKTKLEDFAPTFAAVYANQ